MQCYGVKPSGCRAWVRPCKAGNPLPGCVRYLTARCAKAPSKMLPSSAKDNPLSWYAVKLQDLEGASALGTFARKPTSPFPAKAPTYPTLTPLKIVHPDYDKFCGKRPDPASPAEEDADMLKQRMEPSDGNGFMGNT